MGLLMSKGIAYNYYIEANNGNTEMFTALIILAILFFFGLACAIVREDQHNARIVATMTALSKMKEGK